MKKSSLCEKHLKVRRAVWELQNRSSHFNRTALYLRSHGCDVEKRYEKKHGGVILIVTYRT